MVNLSNTSVGGRYIFSGDSDQQAAYAVDSTQPNGVQQLAPAKSTLVITDANGNTLWTPMTAQQIFDARNTDGTTAAGNVFAAVNGLLTALQNNDSSAATASVDSLNTADDYLNQQLGLIGIAENRVTDATTAASQSVTTETAEPRHPARRRYGRRRRRAFSVEYSAAGCPERARRHVAAQPL